jgi:hypothetical protein
LYISKIILVVYTLSLPYFVGVANAGGISSSGTGEFASPAHNPWFIGRGAVSYCIDWTSDFSLSKDRSSQVVEGVLADWVRSISTQEIAPFKGNSFATNFVSEACSEDTDLRFMFGSSNTDIERLRDAGYLSNKLGFAAQSSFDFSTNRAKGMIWLAPDLGPEEKRYKGEFLIPTFWSQYNVLWNVLLHEVGHVFGFSHQDFYTNNPMNSNYPERVVAMGGAAGQNEQASSLPIVLHSYFLLKKPTCGRILAQKSDLPALRNLGFEFQAESTNVCVKVNWSGLLNNTIKATFFTPNDEKVFEFYGDPQVHDFSSVSGFYRSESETFGRYALLKHIFMRQEYIYRFKGSIHLPKHANTGSVSSLMSSGKFLNQSIFTLPVGGSLVDIKFFPIEFIP